MNRNNDSGRHDASGGVSIQGVPLDAVLLDLDGVITRTASIHARAWKSMFDEYLERRGRSTGEPLGSFSIEEDYHRYVDGKPRYDGVRSFLESRGIDLPWGEPSDAPGTETVCGLGNRKNEFFHEILQKAGAEVFDDAVRQIRRWRDLGLKTAVVSSSRNCEAILQSVGLTHLFDAQVEGTEGARENLRGKPHPDFFLRAAEKLGVDAARAAVLEDAVSGVQAGRAGHFGLVVGVARAGEHDRLKENGADLAVSSLDELDTRAGPRPPSALARFDEIAARLGGRRLALFLDYDGTLTPIVPQPEDALLPERTREILRDLATHVPLAILSGRDRRVVEALVGLKELVYAGSHGFDIQGPDIREEHAGGVDALPHLDTAQKELSTKLEAIPGARLERKRFALTAHYRNVAADDEGRVGMVVDEVLSLHPALRKQEGKKVYELRPDIDWDKGKALLWLLDALGLDRARVLAIYIGDDVTDEDAFRELANEGDPVDGVGIVVGDAVADTRARYSLEDPDAVAAFLERLLTRLREPV